MIDFVKASPLQQHFKRGRLKIEQSLQDLSKEKIPDYRKDPTGRARISLEDPHDFAADGSAVLNPKQPVPWPQITH